MESIFTLSEGDRTAYLQQMSYSYGCTFICLWSYLPHPSNCLVSMDGVYNEVYIRQPIASSSSSTSLPRRLFYEYRKSVISIDNSCVPGIAFNNSFTYLEYRGVELQALTSTEAQLQFYQEARIKTGVFMGCRIGVIELGISNDHSQVNLESEMRKLFPQDFSGRVLPRDHLSQPIDQTALPPSSSSLIALPIINSLGNSPLTFVNIASTSYNISNPTVQQPQISSRTTHDSTFQETIETLNQIRNVDFPSIESEDAAITQAILAVISSSTSPSPTSSASSPQPQPKTSAFKRYYRSVLAPTSQITRRVRRQSMLKRAIDFISNTSLLMRGREQIQIGSRSTTNQLQHMIKERRRREKLNENFQALRSLLPPGSKKDKASVLNSTLEYMNLLIAEVQELSRRNQMLLAAQHNTANSSNDNNQETHTSSIADYQRLGIRISHVAETTSEARILDLRVSIRGECNMSDIVIRVLEFLRQVRNSVSLLSVEANTRMVEATSVTDFVWRLKIEGDENWDETTFLEAVRRVLADLAQ